MDSRDIVLKYKQHVMNAHKELETEWVEIKHALRQQQFDGMAVDDGVDLKQELKSLKKATTSFSHWLTDDMSKELKTTSQELDDVHRRVPRGRDVHDLQGRSPPGRGVIDVQIRSPPGRDSGFAESSGSTIIAQPEDSISTEKDDGKP